MIPEVTPEEKIVRIIFHPYHVKSNNNLKAGAFTPPLGSNEVSVHRLRLVDPNFCKKEGQRMAKEHNTKYSSPRKYVGLALIYVQTVLNAGLEVKKAPSKSSHGHANILYKDKPVKGEPLPARMSKAIKKILKECKYYPDPDPDSDSWQGEELV